MHLRDTMITLTQDELTAVINAHVAAATAKIYADLAKPAVDKINAQIAPPAAVTADAGSGGSDG